MPYQEINLPIWAQLLLMVALLILGLYIVSIKPTEPFKVEVDKETRNEARARYGAYMQSQGRYYN